LHPIRSRAVRCLLLLAGAGLALLAIAACGWLLKSLLTKGNGNRSDVRTVAPIQTIPRSPTLPTGGQPAGEKISIPFKEARNYETIGIRIDPDLVTSNRQVNYWEQKVLSRFLAVGMNSTVTRLRNHPEEKSAVFATLWGLLKDSKSPQHDPHCILLADRPESQAPTALYVARVKQSGDDHSRLTLEFEFIAVGQANPVITLAKRTAQQSDLPFRFTHEHFPNHDFDGFWKGREEERDRLFGWIQQAPLTLLRHVVASGRASFYVEGNKTKSDEVEGLRIVFLGSGTPRSISPPAGYLEKDFADFNLDQLRSRRHVRLGDRLGEITGLHLFTPAQQLPVKVAIWQYFEGGTRNAEVDVRLPGADPGSELLATLHYQPSGTSGLCDVLVENIGTKLRKPRELVFDLVAESVFGCSENAHGPEAFSQWWNRRYPSASIEGSQLDDLMVSAQLARTTGSRDPRWFAANYGIVVMDRTGGSRRLREAHHLSAGAIEATRSFLPEELQIFEAVLGVLNPTYVAELRGLNVVRQAKHPADQSDATKPKRTGMCYQYGDATTVVIFDAATNNDAALFCGDERRAFPAVAHTYVHEIGHAIGARKGRLEQFNRFVESQRILPVTWYATSEPDTEFFPECFALFHLDPAWMKRNQPALFRWFSTLAAAEHGGGGSPPLAK